MLIYGKEWEDAAEPGCEFYARDDNGNFKYQKCSCSKHIEMRDNSKQLSFGLLYGISKYSLAFDLKISVDEAAWLMERFFTMLPNIKKMMDNFGRFAIDNGFIVEPVLGRVRYFDRWKLSVPEEHGGIIRQAYNFPSQGAGGALLKISIALLRRKLNHLNLNDHMMIINPYHDELSMESDPEYAEQGKVLLENAMMDAAKYGGFPGLKASAAIGDSWYDCH
jgi:DNA polymerase I-like protein with 3'-5' exonuclease and polymerase domains